MMSVLRVRRAGASVTVIVTLLVGCVSTGPVPSSSPAGAEVPPAVAAIPPTGADMPPTGAEVPPAVEREFRGVWIAAVSNMDWPSRPGLPPDSQRAELTRMLDRAREMRLNAVVLHIRPAGDALYASSLEPWSEYLTGVQGRAPDPLYDPLEFAVSEAHARGLELHAWFNPYRARHPSARGEAASNHISRANPELVKTYGSYLWMDPGEDAVRQRSVDVVVDVVRRYDVDGVHIDDYFYPYRELGPDGRELDFPDSASYARYRAGGGALGRSDWRRANVDRYVAELYDAVKREKPWVKVGISPIGTWRPNVVPQLGGFDAYESIYADARKWLVDGDLDYLVPQLYWPIARTDVSFPVLLDWWVKQNVLGRGMYAGLIPGNVNLDAGGRAGWAPDEIVGQIYITRGRPGADGHVHFRMGSLMPDGAYGRIAGADTLPAARIASIRAGQGRVQARRDSMTAKLMRETYARPALTPAMTWLDNTPPPAPRGIVRSEGGRTRVNIEPGAGEAAFLWVVQSRWPDGWRTEIVPGSAREWEIGARSDSAGAPAAVWVSAVDRSGNQSGSARAEPDAQSQQPSMGPQIQQAAPPARNARAVGQQEQAAAYYPAELPPGVIPHAEWEATPPLGHAADASRRNLRPGDSLEFRDLRVTVLATTVDSTSPAGPIDVAHVRLERTAAGADAPHAAPAGAGARASKERSVQEGAAFNWQGYHIAIVAVYGPGELGAGLTAVEVGTLASVPPEVAASSSAGGADLRLRIPHRITHVTLHHTGSAEPLRPVDDPVQKLRGLQSWGARDRNWWDVPYHFLIDLDGRVYEGRDWRYMGETNTTYDPEGHFLISMIGNYARQEPSQQQLDAIAGLMAWAVARFDLPLERIGGHYDYAETSCPGEHLRKYLEDGTFARLVAKRLAAGQQPYVPADVQFMQGMIAHHAQAVIMTRLAALHAHSPAIRTLARRIDVSQVDEIQRMRRWLEVRGEAVPDTAHDAHAQHAQHADDRGLMPGMVTPDDLNRLEQARGAAFDQLFLEFMIRHHEGAVTMVADLFAQPGAGREPELFQFASHVDADQRAEIARMRRMLATPDAR